jgi:hypothetical protein
MKDSCQIIISAIHFYPLTSLKTKDRTGSDLTTLLLPKTSTKHCNELFAVWTAALSCSHNHYFSFNLTSFEEWRQNMCNISVWIYRLTKQRPILLVALIADHTPVLTPCNNGPCINKRNALFRMCIYKYSPKGNPDWPLNRRSMGVCFSIIKAVTATLASRFVYLSLYSTVALYECSCSTTLLLYASYWWNTHALFLC